MRQDPTFQPQLSGNVWAIAQSGGGLILVGGSALTGSNGSVSLLQLHHDGSQDSSFNVLTGGSVGAIAVCADGRIVVGGRFRLFSDDESFLLRMDSKGVVDTAFSPQTDGAVTQIAPLANGQTLVAGDFESFGSGTVHQPLLARLNEDGSIDTGFRPRIEALDLDDWPRPQVNALAVDHNGRYIIGGAFTSVNGVARTNLVRLFPDGSVDSGFHPNPDSVHLEDWPNTDVNAVALESDGSIVLVGTFSSIDGVPLSNFARILPSGKLDRDFKASMNGMVLVVAVLSDSLYFVGGIFNEVGNLDWYMRRGVENATLIHRNGIHFSYPPIGEVSGYVTAAAVTDDESVVFGGGLSDGSGGLIRLVRDGENRVCPDFG